MTVEEPGADAPADRPAPAAAVVTGRRTPSQLALERYRRRMRRNRSIYLVVIAAVLVALAISVGIAWSHGETAHTTSRTAAAPAPSVARHAPSAILDRAWQSNDRTAIGTPYWGGTVVTYNADSVQGRNASTGAITWSYTRTDRTVCQAIQVQGTTVAIFELAGNCDEVTALDSGTGERKWTRTLDKDGQPLEGHPSYSLTQDAIMLTTPGVIYVIDPSGGLDRWEYHRAGCTIGGAVIGAQGALISQICRHPKCDELKFCGSGPQLLLRDASAGRSDDAKDKANPDRINWNLIGTRAVPASADQLISAVEPAAGQLDVFDVANGATRYRHRLLGATASTGAIAALASDRVELLWIAGTTYAVDPTGPNLRWTASTPAPPTVTTLSGVTGGTPKLRSSTVAVTDSAGIALLDPDTGKPARSFPVGPLAATSLAYPLGTGFLVAGASTMVYR